MVFKEFDGVATFSVLGAFANLGKGTVSFLVFVCSFAWNNTAVPGMIFMKSSV